MKRKDSKRIAALICALVCLWAVVPAAGALTYATQGNAAEDTLFYVTSAGSAAVTLYQNGTGLMQEYNRFNTAQTRNEAVYAQYIVLYRGSQDSVWQQGGYFVAQNCTINLPRADLYTLWVRPVSPQDMNQQRTYEAWQYQRWVTTPIWYVGGVRNCGISSVNPRQIATATPRPTATPMPTARPAASAPITILYQDVSSQQLLDVEIRYLSPGSQPVMPARSFSGYSITGNSLYYVSVSNSGAVSPALITFYYYRVNQPTATPYYRPTAAPYYPPTAVPYYPPTAVPYVPAPVPTAVPTPQPTARVDDGIVAPIAWDTQFKPGTAKNQDNVNAVSRLPNLYDNDRNTAFFWIVYNSEWKDDVPDITAYFGGASVSGIGVRNGNASSSAQFLNNARPYRLKVRVYMRDGTTAEHTITLPDQYYNSYHQFSLGRTYDNVDRVELFMVNYKVGAKNKHVIYISDLRFYQNP